MNKYKVVLTYQAVYNRDTPDEYSSDCQWNIEPDGTPNAWQDAGVRGIVTIAEIGCARFTAENMCMSDCRNARLMIYVCNSMGWRDFKDITPALLRKKI